MCVYFPDNNLDNIEQNFSDWSDDSADDILNRPGEAVSAIEHLILSALEPNFEGLCKQFGPR
ncbi:hypothetical protein DPMN_136661 [Dreissena polymorpha]|uniref:Uncharacterized protein n=1 Tax=Dreissena polymorpha TaxID=45954 RepID=A0A9D4JGX9_DREPO|nr:hypothetical protein DPMN_136661 [Dreissena polymorpha]